MSAELNTPNTRFESCILGLYGLYFIVLLGIFINCCKNKPAITTRPAPPTPEPSERYESSLYPATSTAQTIQRPRIESDEDFEDVPKVRIVIPAEESRHPSSKQQLATPSDATPGEEQTQPPDYENVSNSPPKPAPESRKDHTYLEVLPLDTEFCQEVVSGDQTEGGGITARKSGTASSLSLSDSHSYENIIVEVDAVDYVNVQVQK